MLQHDALPFSGPSVFLKVAVDVVYEALDSGEVPVVLAPANQLADVRAELGRSAQHVRALDMSVAGRNPARLLPALQHLVEQYPDEPLACVAEPVRAGTAAPLVREIELHELLLALPVFHAWNCSLTCAYDVDALDDAALGMLESAHRVPSPDPFGEVERARSGPLPPRPSRSDELGVDRTTLSALRGFVQQRAAQAGLDDERVDDLVYAVNEAVTNSICHGEGRARVSIWTEERTVVCEVRDRGWIRDPLAGRIAPRPDTVKGRGLWLVNQLCDLVQLRSSAGGTTLRLHVEGPEPARPAAS